MSNVEVHLSDDENIVLQSIAMMDLLFALRDDDFLHSEYGQNILSKRILPNIRRVLEQCEIINQGVIVSGLYTLLVLPRELFGKQGITEVDNYISSLVIKKAFFDYLRDKSTY